MLYFYEAINIIEKLLKKRKSENSPVTPNPNRILQFYRHGVFKSFRFWKEKFAIEGREEEKVDARSRTNDLISKLRAIDKLINQSATNWYTMTYI